MKFNRKTEILQTGTMWCEWGMGINFLSEILIVRDYDILEVANGLPTRLLHPFYYLSYTYGYKTIYVLGNKMCILCTYYTYSYINVGIKRRKKTCKWNNSTNITFNFIKVSEMNDPEMRFDKIKWNSVENQIIAVPYRTIFPLFFIQIFMNNVYI